MTEDIILLNSFFAEEAFDKSSLQILYPIHFRKLSATDTAYRSKYCFAGLGFDAGTNLQP